MSQELQNAKRVVGAKQTLKALQNRQVRGVFLAKDADSHVTRPIREQCEKMGIQIVEVESMAELGKACSIDVGAAVAAIID